MKKSLKFVIIISIIIIVFFIWIELKNQVGSDTTSYNSDITKEYEISENIEDNMTVTVSAVVVMVEEKYLYVMNLNNSLYKVNFSDEGDIGFKQGQEVLIYFDGVVNTVYPGEINNVGKIEIVKEESDIYIPNDVLSYLYSSIDNISILVDEITKTGITLTITDSNEIPFEYSNEYIIRKEIKNENYTGTGTYTEAKETPDSKSTSSFSGIGFEYIWEKLEENSDIMKEDTIEVLSFNEEEQQTIVRIDWEELYGELKEGKYEFLLLSNSIKFSGIRILFTVDENDEITYQEPQTRF